MLDTSHTFLTEKNFDLELPEDFLSPPTSRSNSPVLDVKSDKSTTPDPTLKLDKRDEIDNKKQLKSEERDRQEVKTTK